MQNLLQMGVKSHEAWLKSAFYHTNVSFSMFMRHCHWRSFRVTPCRLPRCWCRQNNWSCTDNLPFTDCNKTHICCKFWLHSLDMKLFEWFEWYCHPKWHIKCPRNFQLLPWILPKYFHHMVYLANQSLSHTQKRLFSGNGKVSPPTSSTAQKMWYMPLPFMTIIQL